MLDSIRFVQGAVAKKDYLPALTHFRIKDGTIRGFNGSIGLHSPITLDLEASPLATPFVKAIQSCKDTIQLHKTPAGKLAIKSGAFKAFIDCCPDEFPDVPPEGETTPLDGNLLPALKLLLPFIAEDASRPWARGILFRGQSALATNNINLIEYWIGYTFPIELNIPRMAVTELLRIGEEPESLQVSKNSCTFHFPGDRWLRTSTCSTEWPDVSKILDNVAEEALPVPDEFWEAVTSLNPFVDELGKTFLTPNKVSTALLEEVGVHVDCPGLQANVCFNIKQLLMLEKVISTIAFGEAPKPCHFFGNRLRGVIVGLRQ